MTTRQVAILGSTGSIGTSTLEVLRSCPSDLSVDLLVAGRQGRALAAQVREFRPRVAGVNSVEGFKELCAELGVSSTSPRWEGTELVCGESAINDALRLSPARIVVAAVVGMAGLSGVLAAIDSGKDVALANKESLVVAGELVMRRARERGVSIIPVDSEHSAIFQVLRGVQHNDLRSVILTASGGPFLRTPVEELTDVTPARALKHPKWNMGAKISIDSATMMNKALEVIEARWLFDVSPASIEVVIHPQSIIHSMIRLVDGTVLAQLSVPDMKGPIAYALEYPRGRMPEVMEHLDFVKTGELTFLSVDDAKFPGLARARACLAGENGACAAFNAANEVAVDRFLKEEIPFMQIHDLIGGALERFGTRRYSALEDLVALTEEVTEWSRQYRVRGGH